MSDPVADFLAREDGAFEDMDFAAPAEQQDLVVVQNGDLVEPAAQNGIHPAGDSGVDLCVLDNPREPTPVSNGRSSPSLSVRTFNSVREEPETIKKWREDHAKLLNEKGEAEAKQKQEMEEAARKELETWKQKRRNEVAERKKQNREAERKLQQEVKPTQKSGDGWEEVAKLVDAVNLKSAAKNTTDTTRMKQLILDRKDQTV